MCFSFRRAFLEKVYKDIFPEEESASESNETDISSKVEQNSAIAMEVGLICLQ